MHSGCFTVESIKLAQQEQLKTGGWGVQSRHLHHASSSLSFKNRSGFCTPNLESSMAMAGWRNRTYWTVKCVRVQDPSSRPSIHNHLSYSAQPHPPFAKCTLKPYSPSDLVRLMALWDFSKAALPQTDGDILRAAQVLHLQDALLLVLQGIKDLGVRHLSLRATREEIPQVRRSPK